MAIEAWEVVVVAVVLIFLFRPRTVTDIAHSLGRTVAEFRGGKDETKNPEQEPSEDLKRVAQSLGINVAGKSAQQLSDDIVAASQKDRK